MPSASTDTLTFMFYPLLNDARFLCVVYMRSGVLQQERVHDVEN